MKMQKNVTTPSKARIIRAVASSTALETGQSIASIEVKLAATSKKYSHLKLAL